MNEATIVILSGGIGGAKLAEGLYHEMPAGELAVIVNTGDDFRHMGLAISPDLDAALYALAGLASTTNGWGREGDSFRFLQALTEIGGESWFTLGDLDLATHVLRTSKLNSGLSLSEVTAEFVERLGIKAGIYPMSDDPVATMIATPDGEIAFQDYFVRQRCAPKVTGLRFRGADQAQLSAGAKAALTSPKLQAIIIAPSNPYLSIDPILAVPGVKQLLANATVPVVAVTPILAGAAVKGPAAKIMAEFGIEPSPLAVSRHYCDLLSGFVLDSRDADSATRFDLPVAVVDTLMGTRDDKRRVARSTLQFAQTLGAP